MKDPEEFLVKSQRAMTMTHAERLNRYEQMCAMYRAGVNLAELGRRFNMSRERARQIVSGLPPRANGVTSRWDS